MKCLKVLLFTTLIGLVVSCNKDKEEVEMDLGYEYINTEIGSYVVYQVDSTIYNDFDATVTHRRLQFKDKIVEEFADNLGRPAHRVERYTRDSSDQSWHLARTYYFVKQGRAYEKVEENLRFVSFVFPPKKDATWNGNRYIEAVDNNDYLADWSYKYTEVNVPATINGIEYPLTSTVLLRDRETVIRKVFAKEVFAKGVGLVYKEWWKLDTQNNFEKPWEEKAEKGYIVKMQAISHGVE